MCGRYGFWNPIDEMQAHWGATLKEGQQYEPRYNIAPGQQALVISNEEPETMQYMQWGLIPSWAKEASKAMINARAETADEKPTFKESYEHKRCVVLASGFYEWKNTAGKKQPYLITTEEEPWVMAGLWNEWTDKETGEKKKTYTILTTQPNKIVKEVHDRMPVLLNKEQKEQWLAAANKELLRAAPEEWTKLVEISKSVNNPENDEASIIEAKKTRQTTLG